MSDKIKFEPEVLELINKLTTINPSIIFEKDDKRSTVIKRTNSSRSIAYILSATDESFQFEEDEMAFSDYPEFYSLLKVFDKPDIIKKDNKIIIKEKDSKINYLLSEAEVLSKGPTSVKFNETTATLKLSLEILKEIKKMIDLVDAEKIHLKVDEDSDELNFKCFNTSHDNSWETVYKLDSESKADIDFTVNSEVFTLIPNYNYMFDINSDGIVRFKFATKHVNLEIFIAEVDN